ncbi:hypothetical protein, partial [Haloferax sp. Atlit-6N]|uniref:hypothetical protein n=1 Tax=Haloferax sp. Atlit-6N TaxID=2077205 RepID=UPI001F22EEB5
TTALSMPARSSLNEDAEDDTTKKYRYNIHNIIQIESDFVLEIPSQFLRWNQAQDKRNDIHIYVREIDTREEDYSRVGDIYFWSDCNQSICVDWSEKGFGWPEARAKISNLSGSTDLVVNKSFLQKGDVTELVMSIIRYKLWVE